MSTLTHAVPAVAPQSCLARWSAVSGIAAGLCIALPAAVEAFTGETAATSLILSVSCAFAIPLLSALFARHPSGGGLTAAAYLVNQIGLGLFGGAAFALNAVIFFLAPEVAEDLLRGPTEAVLLLSAAVFVVGCVLFGISMQRSRTFPRLAVWGYTVLLPLLALLAPLPDSPLTSVLHVLVGATLVRLALAIGRAR
jgi:hypothetical protein